MGLAHTWEQGLGRWETTFGPEIVDFFFFFGLTLIDFIPPAKSCQLVLPLILIFGKIICF